MSLFSNIRSFFHGGRAGAEGRAARSDAYYEAFASSRGVQGAVNADRLSGLAVAHRCIQGAR